MSLAAANPKFRNKRSKAQKLDDYVFIGRMLIRQKTHLEIADALSKERPYQLSRQQVSADCKKIMQEWREKSVALMDHLKEKEIASLDEQERELWAAWEKSKLDAEKKTVESNNAATGKKGKVSVTKEGQCGDPSYMRLILEVKDRRAKLLGLDAPTKSEVSGPGGGPIETQTAQVIFNLPPNGRDEGS